MQRRQFIIASTGLLLSQALAVNTQAQGRLNPRSPNAVALGYSDNHASVDTQRWRKKASDSSGQQRCATCALFSKDSGGCSIFGGQTVAANGWCNAWTRG